MFNLGQSILLCKSKDLGRVRQLIMNGMPPVNSCLMGDGGSPESSLKRALLEVCTCIYILIIVFVIVKFTVYLRLIREKTIKTNLSIHVKHPLISFVISTFYMKLKKLVRYRNFSLIFSYIYLQG